MPVAKNAEDVNEGDRLLLADSMEFTVDTKEHKILEDVVNGKTYECYEFVLDDGLDTAFTKGGSMSIHKDPQDILIVLEDDERPPENAWHD